MWPLGPEVAFTSRVETIAQSQTTSCGLDALVPLNAECSGFKRTICSRPRITTLGASRTLSASLLNH